MGKSPISTGLFRLGHFPVRYATNYQRVSVQDDDFPIRTLFLPTQRQPHVDNRISMLQKEISWLGIWIVLPINWR